MLEAPQPEGDNLKQKFPKLKLFGGGVEGGTGKIKPVVEGSNLVVRGFENPSPHITNSIFTQHLSKVPPPCSLAKKYFLYYFIFFVVRLEEALFLHFLHTKYIFSLPIEVG